MCGFDDSAGRRYHISDLHMKIADYKGAITYKRWFDKNFPDDVGGPFLSFNWSIAYFELGKIKATKAYTIDTAFQNVYVHGLLLDKEVKHIDIYGYGYDMLEFAKSMIKDCKKVATEQYLEWLSIFMDTDEYKKPINEYIAINKLLKDEKDETKFQKLIDEVYDLMASNKNQI